MFLQRETSGVAKLRRNNRVTELCVFLSDVYVFFSPYKRRNLDPICVCLIKSMEKILLWWCMLSSSLTSLLQIGLLIILSMINVMRVLNFTSAPRITFGSPCFKYRNLK